MGCIYKLKNSPFYWIKFAGIDGRPQYESSRSVDHAVAKDLLAVHEGKIAQGEPVTSAGRRLKFKDAADALIADYTVRGCSTLKELQLRLRLHLLPYFGRAKMVEIDTAMIRRYLTKRLADRRVARKARTKLYKRDGRRVEIPAVIKPYANATINRELEHLEAAFSLAKSDGRLLHVPTIPYLPENNVRRGFLDPAQLLEVLAFLPAVYHPVIRFTYMTGWRMHDEVLPLEWRQVDLDEGEIHIKTKNYPEGRVVRFGTDVRALLLAQKAATEALQRARTKTIPRVFHRDGQPITSFYKAWHAACRKAGLPDLIPHDMRRSAARNMIRRGIRQQVARDLIGHKTDAMFNRYNISDQRDQQDAADRLDGLLGSPEVKPAVKLAAVIGSRARRTS